MILPLLVLTTTNDLGTSEATDEMRIDRDASDARYLELLTARAQGIWVTGTGSRCLGVTGCTAPSPIFGITGMIS